VRLNALWWWIDRWRKSTAYTDMTLEEQGAYRNLLDEAHLRGGVLPADERILAKACGDALRWKRVRESVMARFEACNGGWRNSTLDGVIAESRRRADKQSRYRNSQGNAAGNEGGNGVRPHLEPEPDSSSNQQVVEPEGGTGETIRERAGNFCEWYSETHDRLIGIGYIGNPRKDYETALLLCSKASDQELRDAALVWFGMKDKFATQGTRTITKFASRATECIGMSRDVPA
jgi:uncharacterized protein YdaU (DUF1376 family)